MDLTSEKAYQRRAPELAYPVVPTSPEKFAEYAHPPHAATDPLHHFLASIHRLKPRRIYELGAGAGELTTRLAKSGYDVTAVELSAELLSAAQLRARLDGVESRIKFVLGDALTHREKGLGFDLVIASLVLHHLDLEPALDAICAHLAPGGVVLIYEPVAFSRTLQWLRERSGVSKDVSPNERQLNSDDLARIVRRFEDVHISYFRLTARVARLFPAGPAYYRAYWLLSCLDALLLPTWKHLSGSVVIEVRRATTQAENR